MRFYLASALLLLFAIQFTTAQWENIDPVTFSEQGFLRDLRAIGLSYVQQKGVFESTKSPFPGKFYIVDDTEKLERQNTSEVTYYRWSLILKEQSDMQGERGDSAVRTTFTVSYRPSNNNFVVTDYKYTIYPDGYTAPVEETEEEFVGDEEPNQATWTLIDLRPLNHGTSDFSSALNDAIESFVKESIQEGDLPDSNYTLKYVYGAHTEFYGFDSKTASFLVKLVNSEGDNFLLDMKFSFPADAEGEIEWDGEQNSYLAIGRNEEEDEGEDLGEYEGEFEGEFEGEDVGEGGYEGQFEGEEVEF